VQGAAPDGERRPAADPTLLQRLHLTDADQRAREADVPERMLPWHGTLPQFELADAAAHIYAALFAPDAPDSVIKARSLQPSRIWRVELGGR
jgi:hypothetical protein